MGRELGLGEGSARATNNPSWARALSKGLGSPYGLGLGPGRGLALARASQQTPQRALTSPSGSHVSSKKQPCLLLNKDMSAPKKRSVYSEKKICLLPEKDLSTSKKRFVYSQKKICLLPKKDLLSFIR